MPMKITVQKIKKGNKQKLDNVVTVLSEVFGSKKA